MKPRGPSSAGAKRTTLATSSGNVGGRRTTPGPTGSGTHTPDPAASSMKRRAPSAPGAPARCHPGPAAPSRSVGPGRDAARSPTGRASTSCKVSDLGRVSRRHQTCLSDSPRAPLGQSLPAVGQRRAQQEKGRARRSNSCDRRAKDSEVSRSTHTARFCGTGLASGRSRPPPQAAIDSPAATSEFHQSFSATLHSERNCRKTSVISEFGSGQQVPGNVVC